MKSRKSTIRIALISIMSFVLILSAGCYEKFDDYVMNQMGIGQETSEKTENKPAPQTPSSKPKEDNSEPSGPYLHEPTEKFNKVRFADETTDGIYPSDWVCYEEGCWWEMESDIDGKEICLTMYDPSGKAVESIVPTYEKYGNGKPEIMKCEHLQGYKTISRWEKRYTYYGKMDYYREYDAKGMVYSVEFVYNEVTPKTDNGITSTYWELTKIIKNHYENGTVTDKTELPGKGVNDERAKCTGIYDLKKITRLVYDPQ